MQEREAINEILLNINELPLDTSDVIEDINIAIVAKNWLDIARKQILSRGWEFNSTTMTLAPNTSGYIVIPTAFLSVDGAGDTDTYIVRDWKLFNKELLSYQFTDTVECDIIEDISFDDIPHTLANYIVKTASLMAYSNIIGDANGMSSRASMLREVKVDALAEDASKMDGNVLTSTFATTALDRTSL